MTNRTDQFDEFDELAREITTKYLDNPVLIEVVGRAIAAVLRQQHIKLKAESAKLREALEKIGTVDKAIARGVYRGARAAERKEIIAILERHVPKARFIAALIDARQSPFDALPDLNAALNEDKP